MEHLSGWWVLWPKFEADALQIQVKNITTEGGNFLGLFSILQLYFVAASHFLISLEPKPLVFSPHCPFLLFYLTVHSFPLPAV
jgi:hypothetical protein